MKQMKVLHYAVLALILVGGLGAFWFVQPNTALQFDVSVITSVAYVFWGIIYHAMQKDLHQKIVIEYILIGAIAIVLLATVLKPF
jgi:hypothetical protein